VPAEIVTAIVTASGAVVVGGTTYWFTKKREREAELRKEKLDHYKELAVAMSGIIAGESTPESQRAWALACNRMNLVAPQPVLVALQDFQRAAKPDADGWSQELHDRSLSRLFYEMRRDLNVTPSDDADTFRVQIWASGQPPPA